ncbi:MAG: L-2-amino-thiazoline-4-carboxylic acid hydrolase [Candidatus Heimdallarchaeota archaeon]|nr:MAG: L-2-amino-thiazoline-4-carboxylic acid hydrolase [Candidatus Heimdallarchaeota archaeon]
MDEVLEKIRTIRQSWRDPKKLNQLLDEWERDFGDEYSQMSEELVAEHTSTSWEKIASQKGLSSLDDLISVLWEQWTEGEFTIERTKTAVQIYCTKCPIADAYRSINKEKYGIQFHCSEDPFIVKGYNPKITFKRTKTLMNGDEYCDHFYSLE